MEGGSVGYVIVVRYSGWKLGPTLLLWTSPKRCASDCATPIFLIIHHVAHKPPNFDYRINQNLSEMHGLESIYSTRVIVPPPASC